jgi:hypothetical protein
MLKTTKGIHLSSMARGRPLYLIDQIWECMATPTIMIALITDRMRYPN